MLHPLDDTIAAIASPPGGAARGIVRTSGLNVLECVEKVFRADSPAGLTSARRAAAVPGSIVLTSTKSRLPCELYVWPTARSFTGEPAAEIHTIGSRPLLEGVLKGLFSSGARLAEPGEFTLRAFLNRRLDLTQAEAVLGAVDAGDPAQLDVALAQLAGGLSTRLDALRESLLDLLAELEAGFDFPDEDLPFVTPEQLNTQLSRALNTVAGLAGQMESRHESTELVRVVLAGWPNTGKSSLFNALTGQPLALVSDQPATTRDYLTAETDLGGTKCLLIDTAGIEPDPIGATQQMRQAAQAASVRQRQAADIEILCLDSTRPLNPWEWSQLAAAGRPRLAVLTKVDAPWQTDFAGRAIRTSSFTRVGIDKLRERLGEAARSARALGGDVVAGTAVRCRESLRTAAGCLKRASQTVRAGGGEELAAAELRMALEALGKVVGAVYTEDVLDRIFSRFCIGK